jgi:Type II secretion system (T2SS), protein N
MTRGRLALTILAGLAVFLGVLFFYLPASWFRSWLPPQVSCVELGGSVWRGECVGLAVEGAKLGDVIWNLAPTGALRGRLTGDADLRAPLAQARADLDVTFAGAGELRNVRGSFPLDPAFLPQFPADRRGIVSVDVKRAVVADRSVRQLEGTIELRDFREITPQLMELGSYRATFDGTSKPDGAVHGQVSDLGGPFRIEGTIVLTPPNQYSFLGTITGRSAAAERLVREAIPYARPDASGRTEISFEGTY